MTKVPKRLSTGSDGKNVAHPTRDSSPPRYKLGSRSCRACHQRKIRCDRRVPCTNCAKGGITCSYPTKDSDVARKGPTLQTISDRLEQLEGLLSRHAESSQLAAGNAAGSAGGESRTQIRVRAGAHVDAITTTQSQTPGSTWELLLNDEQVVRHASNSNMGIPPRDVSLLPSVNLPYASRASKLI